MPEELYNGLAFKGGDRPDFAEIKAVEYGTVQKFMNDMFDNGSTKVTISKVK